MSSFIPSDLYLPLIHTETYTSLKCENFAAVCQDILVFSVLPKCKQQLDPSQLNVPSQRLSTGQRSDQPTGTYPMCLPCSSGLLIGPLNYTSASSCLESPVSLRSDRYAGAAEANKGPCPLWPALPPVTRWYLLRALF